MIRAEASRRGSLPAFAKSAGIGLRTLEDLVAGERTRYSVRTLQLLESAMQWADGSVQRVIEGGQPIRLREPLLTLITEAWPRLSRRDRAILLAVVEAMLK